MNRLILCEGKTDAILLSYYLEKTCGWMHRKALKGLEIKADERKNEYDRQIVERSTAYVEEIQPLADRYIHKKRLKLKVCLGVTWAIQSPEKVFSFIDEQIRSVRWEDSKILAQCFQKLRDI